MKSVLIILPYFGNLPSYFQAFLHSLTYCNEIDFYLFTDDSSIDNMTLPNCMSLKKMSYDEMSDIIKRETGYSISSPYKLCDYKPLYGVVFGDYCKGYDYWGYCDCDTIMGDVSAMLKNAEFEKYERIGRYGHFTIFKNDLCPIQ